MQAIQHSTGAVRFDGVYAAQYLRPNASLMSPFMKRWEHLLRVTERGDFDPREEQIIIASLRPYQDLRREMTIYNIVTNVGKNDLLDRFLKGSAYTQTIRMGLKGTGTAVAGDTQASHGAWLEQGLGNAPTYTGNRKDVVMGAAASQVSTSPTQAFAITSSGTVFGCFVNNGGSATKDDTSGALFSAGDFTGGSQAVANLDTLNVVWTLTAS